MASPSDEPAFQWKVLIRFLIKENEELKRRVTLLEKRQGMDEFEPSGIDTTALVKKIVARDVTPYQPQDWRAIPGTGGGKKRGS